MSDAATTCPECGRERGFFGPCPTCGSDAPSAVQGQRDLFADDVLERLARSNTEYQREHGHYIVPLAERLLAARAEVAELKRRLGYPEFAR